MAFNPNTTEGIIAITFIVVTFALLVILLTTCIICWCWRYKLHKRKTELKMREAEQGCYVPKKKSAGCCRCCGCWMYCCRCCSGCCEPKVQDKVMVVTPVADIVVPTPSCQANLPAKTPAYTNCGAPAVRNSCGNQQFGWNKDVYVYNTGAPTGVVSTPCSSSSQPVNFSNRWSSCNDGRLVLNAGGMVSKIAPGASPYGGIYPSMPTGVSAGNQFLLTSK